MTQTYDDSTNTLLMGGGGRSAKFDKEGATVVGYVARTETRQRTDIKTGALMTWPDGNPRMQLLVTVSTEDKEDEEDDGMRTVYISIPSQLQKAVADAIRKSGEHGIGIGGKLGVKFVRTEEPKTRGFNGQKIYSAAYEAPIMNVGGGEDQDDLPF